MIASPVVGFAGMTHLGIVSSTAMAAQGFTTICFDNDAGLVKRLRDGDLPILEPQLDDLIRLNGQRQRFTADLCDLCECDVVYIAPDVATDDEGASDLALVRDLVAVVSATINDTALMVVLCQVPPGFCGQIAAVPRSRLFYQVETLVFGNAVERARRPERFIIGCAEPQRSLPPAYLCLLHSYGCEIIQMRYESAELAKIAINCCLVASIGVTNMLAEICERIGADWREIAPALKLDRRIGLHAYLKPGLGIAGGNLERDLKTVTALALRHGTDDSIVQAWLSNSRHRRGWAARLLADKMGSALRGANIAIWGLAYKENTHSIKNAPSLATIAAIPQAYLTVHDPVVHVSVVTHPHVRAANTPLDALKGADALLILTPWPEYGAVAVAEIARGMRGRFLVDPYGMIDRDAAAALGFDYRTLGLAEKA